MQELGASPLVVEAVPLSLFHYFCCGENTNSVCKMDIFPNLEIKLGAWNLDQKTPGRYKHLFSSLAPAGLILPCLHSYSPHSFPSFYHQQFLHSFNCFTPIMLLIFQVALVLFSWMIFPSSIISFECLGVPVSTKQVLNKYCLALWNRFSRNLTLSKD